MHGLGAVAHTWRDDFGLPERKSGAVGRDGMVC
jgi:hypothetical protein